MQIRRILIYASRPGGSNTAPLDRGNLDPNGATSIDRASLKPYVAADSRRRRSIFVSSSRATPNAGEFP